MGGEIRGYEAGECMKYFSKGHGTGDPKFIYGGFFYPDGEENYSKGLSVIFQKFVKNEPLDKVREEFSKLIENTKYEPEGKAEYHIRDVIWQKPRELFKGERTGTFDRYKKGEKFDIRAGVVSTPGGISKRAGLVFLRLLTVGEVNQIDRRLLWDCRRTMVELWKDITKDKQIEKHLEEVLKFERVVGEWTATTEDKIPLSNAVFKAFGHIAPFDFAVFESALILSKVRLFEKRKTPQEILDELKQDQANYNDILEGLNEDYGLGEDWLLNLFERACDDKFLENMRKDWKEELKKLVDGARQDKVVGVFVKRDEKIDGKIGYGTFNIPEKEIEVILFYEESLGGLLKEFKEGFNKAVKRFGQQQKVSYTGEVMLRLKDKAFPIGILIPNFKKLKTMNYNALKEKDSEDLLFSLINFIARLRGFVEKARRDKKPAGVLLLLDTDVRKEDGGYPFWDDFALAYDFFSLPFQTLNRKTINLFCEYARGEKPDKDVGGVFKNLFISFMKDLKSLSLEFEGFNVPEKLTIYAFLEKPSSGFCYSRSMQDQKPVRHYIYEVYKIQIENNKVTVELENKYILLTGAIDFDRQKLLTWIEERINKDTRFYFITAGKWEDSYIKDLLERSERYNEIEKLSLFVEYKELAIAQISEKAAEDCFVIYTSQFDEIRKALGIRKEEDKKQTVSIAIKPADVKDERFKLDDNEQYYHSVLQVFSTTGQGWERDEVYSEKKDVFLLTLLALSNYESESFITPYAKLGLWQRKKNIYLKLRRDNREYTMTLSGVLYELLYLASKIPGGYEKE